MKNFLFYCISISFSLYISFDKLENISSLIITPFILLLFIFHNFKKINVNLSVLISVLFFILFVSIQNIFLGKVFFSGIYWWWVLFLLLLVPIRNDVVKKGYSIFYIISLIIIVIDCYYRFFISDKFDTFGFYNYKYGLIGTDSNFAGIFALILLISIDIIDVYKGSIKVILKILSSILLFLTFSRAAIIAYIFYLIVFKANYKVKWLCFLITFTFILLLLLNNNFFILNDQSGDSKIQLLVDYGNIIVSSDIISLLFGYGIGMVRVGALNPHVLLLQLILGIGFIGAFLYYGMLTALMLNYKKSIALLIPFTLVSFSVAPISLGVLTFVIVCIIKITENDKMLLKTCSKSSVVSNLKYKGVICH
ncbi:hypothetical protein [Photobacterium andalusiense]|uniref:O-Antigen ligase n=1 Tax=Photobacterium andalusiense TaxID=2204296 RepID=A0A1Y6MHA4_9GAMM|nr:hypothetical protein [Photobacterium andalusiense]SMY35965.1 hypothetical protein PAND9192_02293 [Photobacterium andalusiense]